MQLIDIKRQVDLHDLAHKLGLDRPDPNGNYRSPHHADKNPSMSIYMKSGDQRWKDHSAGLGGDCFDLVAFVEGISEADAIKRVREIYGFQYDQPDQNEKRSAQLTTIEYIAQQCLRDPSAAVTYLVNERGIDEVTVKAAIERKSLGFSEYTSSAREVGQIGYGGPAIATICKHLITGVTLGVDYRYLDPALNGGLKTKSQGEKSGVVWTSCLHKLRKAHSVVIVESAINALTVESVSQQTGLMKGWAALAVRGTENHAIDWSPLQGKRVLICMDNDKLIEKGPMRGYRPGLKAAWRIVEQLTALNIPALLCDQSEWEGINDINDYLKAKGPTDTRIALGKAEQHLIPGLPGRDDTEGKARIYLPPHDISLYWRYRVRHDFTMIIKEVEGDEGETITRHEDVCGFRLAALSRITVASAQATMTGEPDAQPQVVFAASVQIPRHGNTLLRRVLTDDGLHNMTNWTKFGPVFRPQQFSRMLAIWERGTALGARNAANFVGLCYLEGKPVLNEGPDCYFSEPDKQCPYHNLQFPVGTRKDAAAVISAYQNTFGKNAAMVLLTWALGGHLKAFLGFWPHMVLQADKGAGKSTLIKRLERSINFTMFSGQSLATEYRLITSVSHTSHPVGWEELSARRQDTIDKAVALLQETYQFTLTRRGTDMTEYLLCAPVLLAGEDVPVDSLLGKVVRTQLSQRGPEMPENLQRFPVREWLTWLASLAPTRVRETYSGVRSKLLQRTSASANDDGAIRMLGNYAAVATAWRLLTEFAELPVEHGNFPDDLVAEMNSHILESRAAREPWVWIMEIVLGEIDRQQFTYPYQFEKQGDDTWLLLRATHCMQHISQSTALRSKFDALPVKSARVFGSQLSRAGVVVSQDLERAIHRARVAHLQAISLNKLREYGLSVSIPEDTRQGGF
ncbi:MAG: toprim domain-containing protein [Pseudohongiella sp.]|nr:toprim domain-containing protein [Pseudohongiella sp.]